MRFLPWRSAALLAAGFTLGVGACGEDKIALSVDLRTDFVPGDEFARVTTEVVPDGQGSRSTGRDVLATEGGFIAGSRVADFGDLPPGGFLVRVRVLSGEGEPLVERQARLTVSSDYALTMVATRNCEGIVCPEPDGDQSKNTCNGGKCVKPECLPQHPELCPEPECAKDTDCQADASCVDAFCRDGTCLFLPQKSRCQSGLLCDVTRGCFSPDAGDCKPSGTTEASCDDGLDDDCDGKTDCEDPDCDAKRCDDQNACTSGETCQKSACSGGAAIVCDDGEACTDDACNPQSGCTATPRSSGPCDDGDVCTQGDSCQNGHCTAGTVISCDDKNPCTDDVCDTTGGCLNTPNTAPCDDGNACTDGDTCSEGSCKAGGARQCDDKNPCTDDACDPKTGCTTKPNSEPCDDGTFCNGADTCKEGTCSVHAGQPCKQSCDEAGKNCVGCLINSDCGPVTPGPWSECSFASPCATTGTQTRTITTPVCKANTCSNTTTTESQPCSRPTDGLPCGTVTQGAWSACDYTGECDTSATRTRSVTTPTCAAGACSNVVTQESDTCTNPTEGKSCGKGTVTGSWSTCGGFANACDTSGTHTRTVTTYACASGACKGTAKSESGGCTRSAPPNGTGCGSGKYCCGGGCYAKNDSKHCSSCGISCGSGQSCVGIGSGHYTCTCNGTNAQCVSNGFGSTSTCWDPGLGKGTLCNCQGGANSCAGGADCFKPSGQNYCSY